MDFIDGVLVMMFLGIVGCVIMGIYLAFMFLYALAIVIYNDELSDDTRNSIEQGIANIKLSLKEKLERFSDRFLS